MDRVRLFPANRRIRQTGLYRSGRALGRLRVFAGRLDGRGRLLRVRHGLVANGTRDVAALVERGDPLLVRGREAVLGLLLLEQRLRRSDLRLGLRDVTGDVGAGLLRLKVRAAQLRLHDRDLLLGGVGAGAGRLDGGGRLLSLRANLGIVERRDHLTGLDAVAFLHVDRGDPSRSLGRDRGVVAFDASAQCDDVTGNAIRKKQKPHADRDDDRCDDDDGNQPATVHERFIVPYKSRRAGPGARAGVLGMRRNAPSERRTIEPRRPASGIRT